MFNRRKFVGALVAVGSVGVPSLSFAAQETSREKLVRLCEEAGFRIVFLEEWLAIGCEIVLDVSIWCERNQCGVMKIATVSLEDLIQDIPMRPRYLVRAKYEEMCNDMLESELNVTMVATVILKDGAPVSVSFTSTEYAAFDVPAYITRLRAEGGFMAEQEAEDMKGFDSLGFRIRTYLAVFSKDSEKQASKPVTPKGWTIEPTYGGAWIVRDENGKDVAGDMSEYHATLRAKAAAKKIGLPEQELTRIHFDWE